MPNKPITYGDPYGNEIEEIERRKKLAEQLQAQSSTPLDTNRMAGGWAIPISPWEGLAKVAQGAAGGYQQQQASELAKSLRERQQGDRSADMGMIAQMLKGAPASSEQIVDEQAAGGMGAPAQINAPARPGGIDPSMMGQLRSPEMQNFAMQQYLEQMKPKKPVVVGRSLLNPETGAVVGQDATWQAEQENARKAKEAELQAKMEDARLSREERAAAQQQLVQMQIDARREIAAQSNALRREISGATTANANKPPAGFRFTPNGDLERIPGGPADIKAEAELTKKAAGAGDVDIALGTLRDAYDRLEKGGGITSTKNEGIGNIIPSLSSSAVGQASGKLFGTQNQSARNDVAMARPALLAALMKATGMSAKQMDSNAELKLWLSTATDPTLDVESNRRALDNIEKKYIGGDKKTASPQDAAALQWANANPTDPRSVAIKQRLGVR